jgi:hypothetical protein
LAAVARAGLRAALFFAAALRSVVIAARFAAPATRVAAAFFALDCLVPLTLAMCSPSVERET